MSQYSSFPSTHSIPPASFYNIQGLAGYLNEHPKYKQYFVKYPTLFPGLLSMTSTLSTIYYNPYNVPIKPFVTTLSYNQLQEYNTQLVQFKRVYEFNSNAYITSLPTGAPIYYSFSSYKELTTYKASIGLVNKLYPFMPMADGTNDYGIRLDWIIPFPL